MLEWGSKRLLDRVLDGASKAFKALGRVAALWVPDALEAEENAGCIILSK